MQSGMPPLRIPPPPSPSPQLASNNCALLAINLYVMNIPPNFYGTDYPDATWASTHSLKLLCFTILFFKVTLLTHKFCSRISHFRFFFPKHFKETWKETWKISTLKLVSRRQWKLSGCCRAVLICFISSPPEMEEEEKSTAVAGRHERMRFCRCRMADKPTGRTRPNDVSGATLQLVESRPQRSWIFYYGTRERRLLFRAISMADGDLSKLCCCFSGSSRPAEQ